MRTRNELILEQLGFVCSRDAEKHRRALENFRGGKRWLSSFFGSRDHVLLKRAFYHYNAWVKNTISGQSKESYFEQSLLQNLDREPNGYL